MAMKSKTTRVGRPRGSTKLKVVRDDFIKLIRSGVPVTHACRAVGVAPVTYHEWMRKGEESHSGMYVDFFDAVMKARADAVARNVALIQKAAVKQWQAAAWWLERCEPGEFARDRGVEINFTQNNVDVEVNISETRERINSRIASISARIGDNDDTQ